MMRGPGRRRSVLIGTAVVASLHFGFVLAWADDTQFWVTTSTTGPLNHSWRISSEVHGRWVNDLGDYQRTVFRVQAGRVFSHRWIVWVGFENTWAAAGRTPPEQRLWQQVTWTQAAGAWQFSHRGRLEERFIDGNDGVLPRLRYQFRASRPLDAARHWSVVASAEAFVRLASVRRGGATIDAGYDRDRWQAGLARQLTRMLVVESTYALQRISLPEDDVREHLIQVTLSHRF